MDPHDVAIAALSEVARVSSQPIPKRDHTDSYTASHAPDSATESRIAPNDTNFIDSQSSSVLPISSEQYQDELSTPPTSDSFSSQSQDSRLQQLSQLSQVAAAQQPLSSRTSDESLAATEATYAGQKRTADGFVPRRMSDALGSGPASPRTSYMSGHSRNTSTASSTARSTLSELGAALRTKLSYAMVKVNNGWQDLPIAEVESVASRTGSPSSSTSTLNGRRNVLPSPRTAIASMQYRIKEPNSSNMSDQSQISSSLSGPRVDQPLSTYESFWRKHSSLQQSDLRQPPIDSSPHPTNPLAPAADIGATFAANRPPPSSRRSNGFPAPTGNPPHLASVSSSRSQTSQPNLESPSVINTPRTPRRHMPALDTMLQTPTQKSIQEQDAIETLLFMSSPGNSNNINHNFPPSGHGSQQPSPLKAEFGVPYVAKTPQRRRLDMGGLVTKERVPESLNKQSFRRRTGNVELDDLAGRDTNKILRVPKRLGRGDDDLDHVLDNMIDDDSSDSDGVEIPLTPARLTATTS